MKKKCAVCGNTFNAIRNKKYCSDACRKIGTREKMRVNTRNYLERKAKQEQAEKQVFTGRQAVKAFEPREPDENETNKLSVAYWEQLKRRTLARGETLTVNGISIYLDDFGERVVWTIRELNLIKMTH